MTRPQILVVCTGNVCRSPYLERRLRAVVDRAWGEERVIVSSAGTGALVGVSMDRGSAALLDHLGISSGDFAARQLTPDIVDRADLVLTATRAHRGLVARTLPRALRYTFAVADFADLVERIPDNELPHTGSAGEWLTTVTVTAARRRGLHAPMTVGTADIVDPFRRGPDVFAEMEAQINRWMPSLERALGSGRWNRCSDSATANDSF